MKLARLSLLLVACSLTSPTRAEARPFRAMITRTAGTTGPQHLEFGLRLQGFFLGDDPNSLIYGSIAPGVRFGIIDKLELNIHLDLTCPAACIPYTTSDGGAYACGPFAPTQCVSGQDCVDDPNDRCIDSTCPTLCISRTTSDAGTPAADAGTPSLCRSTAECAFGTCVNGVCL